MRRLQRPLAIALFLALAMNVLANPLSEEQRRSRLESVRTETIKNITPLERGYLDVYSMLGAGNGCSQFFGGKGSQRVLEELVINLRIGLITDSRIGIRMSGMFTNHEVAEEGISYRLFEQAEVNSKGAFLYSKTFSSEMPVPNVGSFRPNTREARALILLHELAHLLHGSNGNWLIPDDGGRPQLSRENTLTVESRCGQEIRGL